MTTASEVPELVLCKHFHTRQHQGSSQTFWFELKNFKKKFQNVFVEVLDEVEVARMQVKVSRGRPPASMQVKLRLGQAIEGTTSLCLSSG